MQIKKIKPIPWLMWILAASFYGFELFLQVSPAVMLNDLMSAFSANALSIGILASLYFYAYAGMQIPGGMMLDRLGPRRLLSGAVLCVAVGAFLFGIAPIFLVAAIGRLLIGFGSAFAAIGCMYVASIWLPIKRFSMLTGIMLTIGMLGAVNGQGPLAILVGSFGWRLTMVLFGTIGLGLSILLWIFVRDKKSVSAVVEKKRPRTSLLHDLKIILTNKQNWFIAIYGGLIFTATPVFGGMWGVAFIITKYHLSMTFAATLTSILFIGWMLGSPIFGWLSDRFQRRKIFMLIGLIGTFISLTIVIYLPAMIDAQLVTGVCLFIFGFCSGAMPLGFSLIREINPPQVTGTAIGFMNCANMIGCALVPPLIGFILDLSMPGQKITSAYQFSAGSYELALSVLPLLLLISLFMLFGIKETYAKSEYEQTA
jgi:MFS family permease